MTEPKLRKDFLGRYESVRKNIRKQLTDIADHSGLISKISPSKAKEEIRPFLSIGQAGEGLLFLHLAYELIKKGGRIAFVLPKNLLSGSSWFLARSLLASRFQVEYVIVSFDPKRGYNFSESTALSEVLFVARRTEEHRNDEKTCVVCLLKKPDTAISAVQLAHEIAKRYCEQSTELDVFKCGYGAQNIVEAGVVIYTVQRYALLDHIDNWGKLLPFTDPWLTTKALNVFYGTIDFGNVKVKLRMKKLSELADIGIDAHQFHDNFERVAVGTPGAYPALYGGGEEIRLRILNKPNACIMPKTEKSDLLFKRFSSCLLIPDRIWFDTAHIISTYVSEPVLSNIFYSIKFRAKNKQLDKVAKTLCLWLNTTWGLLTVLASREETRGRWMRLKMSHWRLLPVLDVLSLSNEQLDKFEELFRKCENVNWRRLMGQYSGLIPQPERLRLDTEFIKIIKPNINTKEVETFLQSELYPRLFQALKSWIGT